MWFNWATNNMFLLYSVQNDKVYIPNQQTSNSRESGVLVNGSLS